MFIIETKGQEGENLDVPLKMQRLSQWCEDINKIQSDVTYDFLYVDQDTFETYRPANFQDLVDSFSDYKNEIDA